MSATSGPLVAGPGYNAEEAAHIASEFIGSLDNLPGEVVFLLEEIREKEQRIQQLVTRIHTRHLGLTKHLRTIVSTPSATPSSTPLPGPAGSTIPIAHLPAKDAAAITKIQNEWAKVEALQDEKVLLAERMERIVGRAKERGKEEWRKMGGEDVDAVGGTAAGDGVWKAEMGIGEIMLPPGGLGGGGERSNKKRRPTSLALPQPTPAQAMPPPLLPSSRPTPSAHSSYRKPLTSRKRYSTSVSDADGDDDEVMDFGDAEADAEGEAEGDDQLYCTCQQKSYGEMIGCDNEKCPFEWFHLKCVNIVGQPPETWYCPTCVVKLGFISSDGTKAPGSASAGGRGERDKKSRKR